MARRSRSRASAKRRRTRRQTRQSAFGNLINKWTLGGIALVLVGAVGILIAARSSPPTTSTPSAATQQDIPYSEVPRTPLAEAKTKFDAGTALFVDTRSLEEYERKHIPNAIALPLSDLSSQSADLPRDAEIITYCT
ncbi:MAG: rhodanese-like domain-containing protein [Anaerolineae bacterium]